MYSEDVWEEVLPKLQSFYFDAILLKLASLYYQQCSIFVIFRAFRQGSES